MTNRFRWFPFFALALGCARTPNSLPAAPASRAPMPTRAARSVTPPPPSTPAPLPAQPLDPRTADGLAAFLAEICRASAEKPDWVAAHVALPLAGNRLLPSSPTDDPLLGGPASAEAHSMATTDLCRLLPTAKQLSVLKSEGPELLALFKPEAAPGTTAAQYRVRVAVRANEAKLTEFSYMLPREEVPASPREKRKPKAEYIVNGHILQATGSGAGPVDGVFVQDVLERDPRCIERYVTTYEKQGPLTSAAFTVRAIRIEGQRPEARVYASTIAPASLLGCIEQQVDTALVRVFANAPAFEVHYHVMLGFPVKRGDPDIVDNADVMIGSPD